MSKRAATAAVVATSLVTGVLLGAAPAGAATASISVSPASVPAGGTVTVSGTAAGGCTQGSQVTLISQAFSAQHEFAGVPAIFATTGPGGRFSTSTQIPSNRAAGSYTVSGRCGGGNLGKHATLRVTAGSGTLAFTGSAVWLLGSVGLVLLASGLAVRRFAAS
jgi:hypothetical protein